MKIKIKKHSGKAVKRKSILDLTCKKARAFFLKPESYCNIDFPPYLTFDQLLSTVDKFLQGKKISNFSSGQREYDDLNHVIFNNKDGKYAWRPLQLIHPVIYCNGPS